jgi:hypothetical protein
MGGYDFHEFKKAGADDKEAFQNRVRHKHRGRFDSLDPPNLVSDRHRKVGKCIEQDVPEWLRSYAPKS